MYGNISIMYTESCESLWFSIFSSIKFLIDTEITEREFFYISFLNSSDLEIRSNKSRDVMIERFPGGLVAINVSLSSAEYKMILYLIRKVYFHWNPSALPLIYRIIHPRLGHRSFNIMFDAFFLYKTPPHYGSMLCLVKAYGKSITTTTTQRRIFLPYEKIIDTQM